MPDDEQNSLSRIERLSSGEVVQMVISESENSSVSVSVTGQADPAEVEIVTRHMLQLDHSLQDFYSFCAKDPDLRHIPERKQGRFLCSSTVFEDCVKVLLTTNTTWSQTASMVARIVQSFGSAFPGDPELRAFPTPQQIVSVSVEEFTAVARVGYRASAVYQLATDTVNGSLDLEKLRDPALSSDAVWKQLLALKGIGPYAAACLMLYVGRGSRVNVDSWARTLLAGELGRPVSDREVYEYFAKYGDWQGYVYNFYNWKA